MSFFKLCLGGLDAFRVEKTASHRKLFKHGMLIPSSTGELGSTCLEPSDTKYDRAGNYLVRLRRGCPRFVRCPERPIRLGRHFGDLFLFTIHARIHKEPMSWYHHWEQQSPSSRRTSLAHRYFSLKIRS